MRIYPIQALKFSPEKGFYDVWYYPGDPEYDRITKQCEAYDIDFESEWIPDGLPYKGLQKMKRRIAEKAKEGNDNV